MLNRASEAARAGRRRGISGWLGLSAGLLLIGAAGCGESGTVAVSQQARARITADADADGKITLPKTRNPRKPAAGLKTFKAVQEQKEPAAHP
jgi:hypothetical protein